MEVRPPTIKVFVKKAKNLQEILRCVFVLSGLGTAHVFKGKLNDEGVIACVSRLGDQTIEACFVYEEPLSQSIPVKDIPGQPHASVFILEGLPPPISKIFERFREELKRLKPEETLTLEV